MARLPVRVVVMVDTLIEPGGGERLAVDNAVLLDRHRFDRSLCITRWDDRLEEAEPARSLLARLREADVRVIKLRRSSKANVAAWWPLVRLLRDERVDVLHAHMFGSNVWGAILGRLARVPAVVAHEHIWAYDRRGLRPFLDREVVARFSDAFVTVSDASRRLMIEHEGINGRNIVVITNGIASRPAGEGTRVRAELGISEAAPVVGSVGNLRAQKAYELLIEAAVLLRRRLGPDLRVLIAGEGPERPALEGLIDENGLAGTVKLLGMRSDIPDVLAALDVAVCCSDYEGSPLAVMEYMEAGLAVVATRVSGLLDVVIDGENGVLVPARDPEALAAATARLLEEPDVRTALGERGTELHRELWSLETWIRRVEELYERLLSESRLTRAPA
jgi:glycosyltransferase involved in cell wall biosynthesis